MTFFIVDFVESRFGRSPRARTLYAGLDSARAFDLAVRATRFDLAKEKRSPEIAIKAFSESGLLLRRVVIVSSGFPADRKWEIVEATDFERAREDEGFSFRASFGEVEDEFFRFERERDEFLAPPVRSLPEGYPLF